MSEEKQTCPGCGGEIEELVRKAGGSWEHHVINLCNRSLDYADDDERDKGDTLANLGMCQDDFR